VSWARGGAGRLREALEQCEEAIALSDEAPGSATERPQLQEVSDSSRAVFLFNSGQVVRQTLAACSSGAARAPCGAAQPCACLSTHLSVFGRAHGLHLTDGSFLFRRRF